MFILIRIEHRALDETASIKLLGTYELEEEAYDSMQRSYGQALAAHSDTRHWIDYDSARVENEFFDEWNWYIFDTTKPREMWYSIDTYAWNID